MADASDTSLPIGLRAALLAVLLAVVLGAAVSTRSLLELNDASRWVVHTEAVRTTLADLLGAVTTAESASRGYVLTDSRRDLHQYRRALAMWRGALARLQALTADNSPQARVGVRLAHALDARSRSLSALIKTRKTQGFAAAQHLLATGPSVSRTEAIGGLLGQLRANEASLMAARTHSERVALWVAEASFAATAILLMVLLALLYGLLQRNLGQRARTMHEREDLLASERSARVAARRALTEMQALLDVAPLLLLFTDDPGDRTMRVNAAGAQLLGLPPDARFTLDGADGGPRVLHDGAPLPTDRFPVRRAAAEGIGIEVSNLELVWPDGRRLALFGYVAPLFDEGGAPRGSVGAFLDVTERIRIEEALRASEAKLRRLVDSNIIGVVIADEMAVREANSAFLRLVGYRAEDLEPAGLPWQRLTPAEYAQVDAGALAEIRATGRCAPYEKSYVRRDGTHVPVLVAAAAIEGTPLRWVGFALDLTAQKEVEAQRETLLQRERDLRIDAEDANRAKDAFLATVSHELRTPLSPILTWAQMLRRGTVRGEKARRALETIDRCARTQAQLIEDLLDVSRIIAGKFRLEVRAVRLGPIVDKALEVVRPAAEAKGVRLEVGPSPPATPVSGDPDRLQQVVWNLLTNAIKFTARGGLVRVGVEALDSHLAIIVRDTGAGISPQFLPHLFERFRQADMSSTRIHGGLGLGLAIVRHIVEAHGGTVQADSPGEGQGAVFTVRLPVLAVSRRARDPDPARPTDGWDDGRLSSSLRGLCVLVVDDDPDSNEAVRALLADCGAEVGIASSAEQARALLPRLEPDLLVSDIGMPGEDGLTLIQSLRGTYSEERLPAVALTAYATVEDRVRVLGAGFQAHVVKPVDPAELVEVLAGLAHAAGKS